MSSEVSVSDDEDKQDFSSYDDSFIDDRIDPTSADSQVEAGEVDMIAVYRFLLSSLYSFFFFTFLKFRPFLGT